MGKYPDNILEQIRPLRAEIDLDAFAFTMQSIKKRAGEDRHVYAVVKANAYGHGVLPIIPTLLENGADGLCVALFHEAFEIRDAGFNDVPILILGYSEPILAEAIVKYDLDQTVYTYELAQALSEAAVKQGKTAHVHIKADTGMGRIGFLPTEESLDTIEKIFQLPNLEFTGLFTHFAKADYADKSYTQLQWQRYNFFLEGLKKRGLEPKIRHTGNSAVIVDHPEYFMDMVRPGIILYGVYPSDETQNTNMEVRPALSLKCRISNVKHEKAGERISYGGTFETQGTDSIIATLPLGYADGFHRLLSNQAEVLVHGKRARIAGRVCMDQCMIDVTDIPDVKIGDEVVIIGTQGDETISIEEVCNRVPTIPHEIFCDINRRVPRVYFKNGEIVDVLQYLPSHVPLLSE